MFQKGQGVLVDIFPPQIRGELFRWRKAKILGLKNPMMAPLIYEVEFSNGDRSAFYESQISPKSEQQILDEWRAKKGK